MWPEIAYESPFLVDQFEKFFIGGIDDMSGWVKRMWQQTMTMIEKGTRYGKFSKTCLKRPLKNRPNKDLNDKW